MEQGRTRRLRIEDPDLEPRASEIISKKLETAYKILMACKCQTPEFGKKCNTNEEVENLVKQITLLEIPEIRFVASLCFMKPNTTFRQILMTQSNIATSLPYDKFRSIIYKLYLQDEKVPNENELLKSFTDERNYTVNRLRTDLKENGFVKIKLADTNKALFVEDPRQVYRRMIYLNKIRIFREQNRQFVYIKCCDDKFAIVVSPSLFMIKVDDYPKKDGNPLERNVTIIESVSKTCPQSHVIILETNAVKISKPDQYSSKKQMKDWLRMQNIPFYDEAHTAELYALIQKFGDKDTCYLSDFFESQGFQVLNVPPRPSTLSYFDPIFQQVKGQNYMPKHDYFSMLFNRYERESLCQLEDKLKKEELKVYSEDLAIEKVIEKIRIGTPEMLLRANDFKHCNDYDPLYIVD